MLAKTKEKDVIDQLLDQIDFHGMTAEELAGENGLLKKLTSRFYSKALDAEMDEHLATRKMTMLVIIPATAETDTQISDYCFTFYNIYFLTVLFIILKQFYINAFL